MTSSTNAPARRPQRSRADVTGVPRATMRMQFHEHFTFDDAARLVPYLARLGVSHLYASPILKARPGSTHGYDCVDATTVNPELGGEDALRRLTDALHREGLGLVVDIVPNHMGVGNDNGWWQDVLLWGPASRYAGTFDIDWKVDDPILRGKLLAPFLGKGYGETLESGDLVLAYDDDRRAFDVRYFESRYPVAIGDYATILDAALDPALARIGAQFAKVAAMSEALLDERDAALAAARDALAAALDTATAAKLAAALAVFDAKTTEGRARLHALLDRQSYRLASWRVAADEINWRRFFEVTELAGVRVENDDVFDAVHAKLLGLYRDGVIDSMRVDHVDGLADPRGYCRELRKRLEALQPERPESPWTRPYIVVEKILASNEDLRPDWRVDGTSGYDFMDEVGALLHDAAGAEPLAACWARATSRPADCRTEVLAARRQIIAENLPAEFNNCARALHRVARADIETRDIGFVAIQRALTELLVQIDVYRTYVDARGRDEIDTAIVVRALRAAHETVRPADRPVLAWLDHWLGGESVSAAAAVLPEATPRRQRGERRIAITRFQQLTPPLAAKSVEDTAFYRYGRLISRNEVGSNPDEFALSIDAFHAKCLRRASRFPHAILAVATHDHKRGADTRARLAVLSELPARWTSIVDRWLVLNTPAESQRAVAGDVTAETAPMVPPAALAAIAHTVAQTAPAPLPEDQLMLMQTLVGAWPLELAGTPDLDHADVRAAVSRFVERVAGWQVKALRETKRPSDWSMPNEQYESMCRDHLERIMDPDRSVFLREAAAFVDTIAAAGALNGIVQAALHLTVPGVPDLYQGLDGWDFSLVDPDNRRPVDYALREHWLAEDDGDAAAALADWPSGRVKQFVVTRLLALRARKPSLFARGAYEPLEVEGPMRDHALAFLRSDGRDRALVVVTLKAAGLVGRLPLVDAAAWAGTTIGVPIGLNWTDALTARDVKASGRRIALAATLVDLPVAVLQPA